MNTDSSIGAFTRLRNRAFKLYFASGKVKLATAAVKEQYVRWRLNRLLQRPESVTPPDVPVRDDIVLSLTSWEKRLDVLPLALYCLVNQSVWPSRFEVWLTEDDLDRLPDKVRTLFLNYGVRFRASENYGPHTKWLPAIREERECFVVTADDDILYPRHWLRWLLRDFNPGKDVSVAHRCNEITFDEGGEIKKYDVWKRDVGVELGKASNRFVGFGVGGQILHHEWIPKIFINTEYIRDLCPKADDIWLAVALRAAGVPTRNSRVYLPLLEVADTYDTSLQRYNLEQGMNDEQIEDTMDAFDLGPDVFRDGESVEVTV